MLVTFFQTCMYWFARCVFAVFINLKVSREKEFSPERPCIVVANHQSHLDAFLIFSALPYGIFKKIRPAAFMTKNKYTDHWWKRLFTSPLGMFPAHENGKYPAGLEMARTLMQRGYSLVMFPEGKIGSDREHTPKKGTAVLAFETQKDIYPVRINWNKKGFRREALIVYGEPFRITTDNYDLGSREIMDQIYGLVLPIKK